ncbi:MAG: polysaccharide deacetylase family protein [Thermoleophilia bacterium]
MTARTLNRTRLHFLALALALLVLLILAAGCGGSETDATDASTDEEPALCHTPEPSETVGGDDNKSRLSFEPLSFPVQAPSPAREVKLPVLMFHHVGDPPADADEIRRGLTVSASDFEAMMGFLKKSGYSPVSEKQLFRALFSGEPLPTNPVMLTLDDGYLDNYTVAAPILEKYDFPATFYIVSEMVGTPEYMTWEQVAGLDSKGMDIGSHTCTHADLTTLAGADLNRELKDSAAAIESHLGHPVYWFCYPAGKYDADVTRAAQGAGYLLATTTKTGEIQASSGPYELLRYRVRSDTGVEGFGELVK